MYELLFIDSAMSAAVKVLIGKYPPPERSMYMNGTA
jgi:hypothetical protein